MEFAIGIGIGIIIGLITDRRKKRPKVTPNTDAERLKRQKADEEIVTVVLPTIDNNK